ncbi:hypothetical protein V8E53_000074 [Lactarius tabidus]
MEEDHDQSRTYRIQSDAGLPEVKNVREYGRKIGVMKQTRSLRQPTKKRLQSLREYIWIFTPERFFKDAALAASLDTPVVLAVRNTKMSNTEATRKQLKIKTGVVKRYQKELALYNAEIVGNKKRLASAIATAAAARGEAESRDNESAVCFATESYMAGGEDEPWEVKNARNLIRESEKMVRDTAARLERATEELSNFVKSAKGIAELEQGAELLDAEAVLAAPTSA